MRAPGRTSLTRAAGSTSGVGETSCTTWAELRLHQFQKLVQREDRLVAGKCETRRVSGNSSINCTEDLSAAGIQKWRDELCDLKR